MVSQLRTMRTAMTSGSSNHPNALINTPSFAMMEQYSRLKDELDLIYAAINKTKREIAFLHGQSFNGAEIAKVTGELDAVVVGTEQATQTILAAAETIEQSASSLQKSHAPEQASDIRDQVMTIFEACNFQDLTGQRIAKVMATMKFVEQHIAVMMEIWGGAEMVQAHAPAPVQRSEDESLLNGPKRDGDAGHVSQDDIDALFG
jgi:chemotaxis protein CheZ